MALPVKQNLLSEYLGQCNHYEIFEVHKERIINNKIAIPPVKNVMQLPQWIANMGLSDVIVHKLDKQLIHLFAQLKVNLFIGIPLNSPEQIIRDYLNGNLQSNEMIIHEITG